MNNLMDTLVISLVELNILLLLLHSCITVETNYSVEYGKKGCGQRVGLRDPAQTLKLIVQAKDCVSHSGLCRLVIEAEDSFVKKMYKVCADGNNWPLTSCSSVVIVSSLHGFDDTLIICDSIWRKDKKKCSSGGVTVRFQGLDICSLQGEMSVYLEKTLAYANSYDLSDTSLCKSSGWKKLRGEQQLTSWYNSSSGVDPSFCRIEVSLEMELTIHGFCLEFHHAYFPVGGAKLIVERHQQVYNYSDGEHNGKKQVQLDVVKCFPIFRSSSIKGLFFSIKPNDRGDTGNQRYDHALFLTLTFQRDGDDSGDYTIETDDTDSEFKKKIIIGVAVSCLAMFVCCYYVCAKSKQQTTNSQQEALDDSGVGRAPNYECEPLAVERHNEMPMYIHPTRTIIDDPILQQPSPHEQRANRSNAHIGSAGFDQAPPQYAHVSPIPSAPPARQTSQPARQQPTAATDPPPAYDSLFPERK